MPPTKTQAPAAPSASLLNQAAEATRDLFTYPPASLPSSGGDVSPSAPTAPSNLSQLASDTIKQALGWRFRSEDVRGFAAALTRSFTLTQNDDGQVDYTWTPQSAGIVPDMGEVTGAQASILEQARTSIGYILPLLDGLKPLRVDSDPEDIAAVTSIVRMKLNTIQDELARPGGPRVQRLDLTFEELLGVPTMRFLAGASGKGAWVGSEPLVVSDSDAWQTMLDELDRKRSPKRAYSLLRQLCEEYGLDPQLANTVEEERDYTNALIIIDTVIALRTAWVGKRAYFDRSDMTKQRFLGTQLVWMSRQLDVVVETVREAYSAMDSVYFDQAERDATDIHFKYLAEVDIEKTTAFAHEDQEGRLIAEGLKFSESETHPGIPTAPLSVGELMEWIERWAKYEAKELLQTAGKDGVLAFRSTLSRLIEWVEAARKFAEQGRGRAPRSFFTSRVVLALREIETQLGITAERARGISRNARESATTGPAIADLPKAPAAKVAAVGPISRDLDPPAVKIMEKVTEVVAKKKATEAVAKKS
jgi:hypothetical protein